MWLRKFRVRNVGPFVDRTFELPRGSVGIFGKNGAGKSTLLNLMYAGVTGDFGRFDGVKVDCIRSTAGPKDEASLETEIAHNEHLLRIRRKLRGSPATELIVDDGKPITDANKAQAEINRVLGVDRNLIDLYCFKTQDRIYDFISTTPTVRAQAYQTLCRTEHCEKAWNLLGKFLSEDNEANVEIIDNSDELSQAIQEAEQQIATLEERIEEQRALLLNSTSYASANQIVIDHELWLTLGKTLTTDTEKLEALYKPASEARKAADVAKEKLAEARRAVAAAKPGHESARLALRALATFKANQARKQTLEDEKAALVEEKKKKRKPAPPLVTETYDELVEEKTRLRKALTDSRAIVDEFGAAGQKTCPTCKTVLKEAPAPMMAQARTIVKDTPAALVKLDEKIAAWRTYQADLEGFNHWEAGYAAKVKANEKALAAFEDEPVPDGDEDDLHRTVADFRTLEQAESDAMVAQARASDKATRLEADIASREDSIKTLMAQRAKLKQKPELVEKAKTRLAEHAKAEPLYNRLEGEVAGYRRTKTDKRRELEALRNRLNRSKKVRSMGKIILNAREVLHRDRLPRRVARVNLMRMEGHINRGLEHFGAPFWVESDETLSFIAHKPGEPPLRAAQLSTGQRVILAIPFWFAVASLWGEDLGMLALDEPTANLDADNKRFLSDALGALSAKVRGRRQVLMVTHDHDLRASFDLVIDI